MKRLPVIALVLTLCALVPGCQSAPQERRPTGPRPEIEALAPKGNVAFPFAFEWRSTGSGVDTVFRLSVYDSTERELFTRDVRVQRYETQSDLQSVLSSSKRFLWRVAVVDQTGLVVTQTPPVECTVTGK